MNFFSKKNREFFSKNHNFLKNTNFFTKARDFQNHAITKSHYFRITRLQNHIISKSRDFKITLFTKSHYFKNHVILKITSFQKSRYFQNHAIFLPFLNIFKTSVFKKNSRSKFISEFPV